MFDAAGYARYFPDEVVKRDEAKSELPVVHSMSASLREALVKLEEELREILPISDTEVPRGSAARD